MSQRPSAINPLFSFDNETVGPDQTNESLESKSDHSTPRERSDPLVTQLLILNR